MNFLAKEKTILLGFSLLGIFITMEVDTRPEDRKEEEKRVVKLAPAEPRLIDKIAKACECTKASLCSLVSKAKASLSLLSQTKRPITRIVRFDEHDSHTRTEEDSFSDLQVVKFHDSSE